MFVLVAVCELISKEMLLVIWPTWSPAGNGEKAVLPRSASPSGPCCCAAAFARGAVRRAPTAASAGGVTADCSARWAAA